MSNTVFIKKQNFQPHGLTEEKINLLTINNPKKEEKIDQYLEIIHGSLEEGTYGEDHIYLKMEVGF